MLSVKEVTMTKQIQQASSRRTILAGALGVGALGSIAMASDTATAALGDPAIPSDPEVAFYLSIPGVPGTSTVRGFEGQIELLTWAWGVDSTASLGSGGGGGAGKPVPRDLVVAADSGIHSPVLLTGTNTGQHLETALLSCVRSGRRPFTFMTLRFDDLVLKSYAVTPDPTGAVPIDVVHLEFAKITFSVVPQNPDGSLGTPITSTFDYETNKAG